MEEQNHSEHKTSEELSGEVRNVPEQEATATPESETVPEPSEGVSEPNSQPAPEALQSLPEPTTISHVLIACACGNSCTFKQDSLVLVRESFGRILPDGSREKFDIFIPLYTCVNCHRQWFVVGGKVYLFEPGKVERKLSPEGSR